MRAREETTDIWDSLLSSGLSRSLVSISVRDAYREWLLFIERHNFDEVLALMVDPSEEGKRLRKATPFSGILSQEERAAITHKVVAAK